MAMARGRREETWQHTSSLMALLANLQRNPETHRRPWVPDQFNPLRLAEAEASQVKIHVSMDTAIKMVTGK